MRSVFFLVFFGVFSTVLPMEEATRLDMLAWSTVPYCSNRGTLASHWAEAPPFSH